MTTDRLNIRWEAAARAAGWKHGGDNGGVWYHGEAFESWKAALSDDAAITYATARELCEAEDISADDIDPVACANCEWCGDASQADPCRDFWSRVEPGDTVPAGDCPECGAFCFPVTEADPDSCTCDDRSWHGPEHDTACPLDGPREAEPVASSSYLNKPCLSQRDRRIADFLRWYSEQAPGMEEAYGSIYMNEARALLAAITI